MKIFLAEEIFRAPLIDILGGPTQVFQSSPWLIMDQLTDVLSRADFALVPHDAAFWDSAYVDSLRRISEKVPLIYFNRSDFPISLHIPNSFSLQNHFSGPTGANRVIIPYNVKSLDISPNVHSVKFPHFHLLAMFLA